MSFRESANLSYPLLVFGIHKTDNLVPFRLVPYEVHFDRNLSTILLLNVNDSRRQPIPLLVQDIKSVVQLEAHWSTPLLLQSVRTFTVWRVIDPLIIFFGKTSVVDKDSLLSDVYLDHLRVAPLV